MNKSTVLLLLALLVSIGTFSQSPIKTRPVQTIRGIVIDGDSKHPIPQHIKSLRHSFVDKERPEALRFVSERERV